MARRDRTRIRRPAVLLAAVLLTSLMAGSAQASQAPETMSAELAEPAGPSKPAAAEQQVWDQVRAEGSTDFWVYLRADADLSRATTMADRGAQGRFVYERLTRTAKASQADLIELLTDAGAPHHRFWIANTVRVTGNADLVRRVAALPEVERITADRTFRLPQPAPADAEPKVRGTEWNVDRIKAPRVWDTFGATGEGIVVGVIDSGAQFDHPALVSQYRGNQGDGEFDHSYNWHDPSAICTSPALTPCDNVGHGTHVTGTIVGDDGGANQIGVAPGAEWIAAKGCETRNCSQGALLSAGQFMLAPTDLNGENPDPTRRPHIVNNSWGGNAGDEPWYQPMVDSWLAAGIFPQFANGNTSSGVAPCGSAGHPGNLAASYAAGAFDSDGEIADFSNRGPSPWDEALVKPNISAPGVNIRSAVPGDGYEPNNGTSMASPHVAGAVALLWSAADPLVRDIDATRELLDRTAIDVEDLSCGGEPGDNNVWGQGRLDAFAAVEQAPRGPSGRLAGIVTDAATGEPITAATLTISGQTRERRTGEDGGYEVVLPVGEYTVNAAAFGYAPRSIDVTIADGATTPGDVELQLLDMVTVSGVVTDGSGHGWPMYAEVDVLDTPVRAFTDPATGRYELTLPAGETYQLRVRARYPGYADTTETVETDTDVTLDPTTAVDSCERAPGYAPADGDACQPVDGGLVVGNVTDANTGDPVNAATVTGAAGQGDAGTSVATPDDPAVGDGFYWVFSAQTGRTPIVAAATNYADDTRTVDVVSDAATAADFVLTAGQLSVDRTELGARLRLGESANRAFTITNTGTAPAEVELADLPGTFEVLGDGQPETAGEPWQAPAGMVPNPAYDPNALTAEERYRADARSDVTPSAAGEVLASWQPADMSLAWGVGFDGDVWLSEVIGGGNRAFTPDGTATGAQHPTPWAEAWPADMALAGPDEMCQVAVGDAPGIYCWGTGDGAMTRSITGAFDWTALSQRGLAYRPGDDTFYIGGWNEDVLYQVAGFSHETPGEVLHRCDFGGMGISGLAWNPTAQLLWIATNTAADNIYLVEPDGCGVVDSLGHPSPGYNGAGLHLNDQGDLWLTSQGSDGSPNAAYLVASGVPDAADVPWLRQQPATATLAPGEDVTVTVTMDGGATDQDQPGTYTAGVLIGNDTPYRVDRVMATMDVTPPPGWGRVTGTVAGVDCGGARHVPLGATVQIEGRFAEATVRADSAGRYTHWLHVRNNPVQLRATADGHQSQGQTAPVRPRRGATANFTLGWVDEFGYLCAPEDARFQQGDTVLPITGRADTAPIDLPFPFPFYGETYTKATVCSNGYIELMGPSTSFPIGCTFPNVRIPEAPRPNAAIFPYRDANLLVDDAASIRVAEAGTAPNRRLVVEFRNIGYADLDDPTRRVDFNAVLHENGDVLTQYRDIADDERERGGAATIGIEDHTGTVGLQYAFNEPVLEVAPAVTSIRYQAPPPEPPEPGPEAWTARYDGPAAGDEVARGTQVSPDGTQVFVTGHSPGDGTGNDYATVAYDTATGDEQWAARYDGPASGGDSARAVEVSPDGSRVFVTGHSPGDGTGDDYATVAYDAATGEELWVARYDGTVGGGDQAYALAVSPDGDHVFVTGRSIGDATSFDYATVAYDAATGAESWAARYDGPLPSYGFDQAFALGVSPDSGQVYVTGQSRGDGTGNDYATVAYDAADGTQSWVARYDGPVPGGADVASAVAVSPDGSGVYVTGQSEGDGTGNDYATVGYDAADGTRSWVARYDGTAARSDLARGVAVSPDGDRVFVTGQSQGDGFGNDYATVGYDAADGTQSWVARYDGPVAGADLASAIAVSPDGTSVFVTGQSPGGVGTGAEYATVAYQAGSGEQLGSARYKGPVIGDSVARVLSVSPDGARVYVSGDSVGVTGIDYATVAYDTAGLIGAG